MDAVCRLGVRFAVISLGADRGWFGSLGYGLGFVHGPRALRPRNDRWGLNCRHDGSVLVHDTTMSVTASDSHGLRTPSPLIREPTSSGQETTCVGACARLSPTMCS